MSRFLRVGVVFYFRLVSVLVGDVGDGDVLTVRGDVLVASLHGETLLLSVVFVVSLLLSGGAIAQLKSRTKIILFGILSYSPLLCN